MKIVNIAVIEKHEYHSNFKNIIPRNKREVLFYKTVYKKPIVEICGIFAIA